MGRLAIILKQRLPAIIFIIAAVIGGIFIFRYTNDKEDENSNGDSQYVEAQDGIDNNGEEGPLAQGQDTAFKERGQPFSSTIPYGLRAVSLPVSFFGDVSGIREGDRVDVISVFYDPGSNELYCEAILYQKEIILLAGSGDDREQGGYQDTGNQGYFGDGILGDISSGNGTGGQYKKILIVTFYLEVIEAEKAFMAIESGQLYLLLCPPEKTGI